MKYFVDMVAPPTRGQAAVMVGNGYTYCAVYVGGPRAAAHDIWHQRDGESYPVRDLANYFEGFLPIYVGRNQPWDSPGAFTYENGKADGDEANYLTGACGFNSNTPLALDMEYGTWQANPTGVEEYIRGWVESVNAAGHRAGLYSDVETLNHYVNRPDLIDFVWGAAWVRGTFVKAPIGGFDPQSPPPWDCWQFGGAVISGVSVDCSSATDSFEFAKYG